MNNLQSEICVTQSLASINHSGWGEITQEYRYSGSDSSLGHLHVNINTMLCPIKVNSNTIELTVHNSCYCVLDLRCVSINLMNYYQVAKLLGKY